MISYLKNYIIENKSFNSHLKYSIGSGYNVEIPKILFVKDKYFLSDSSVYLHRHLKLWIKFSMMTPRLNKCYTSNNLDKMKMASSQKNSLMGQGAALVMIKKLMSKARKSLKNMLHGICEWYKIRIAKLIF